MLIQRRDRVESRRDHPDLRQMGGEDGSKVSQPGTRRSRSKHHITRMNMNTSLRLAGVLVALFSAGTAAGQQPEGPAGLLGQRYVEADVSLVDLTGVSRNLYGFGIGVNWPMQPNIDVHYAYGYSWLEGDRKLDQHLFLGGATGYFSEGPTRPFGTVTIGYQDHRTAGGRTFWSAMGGVEHVASSRMVLTGRFGYSDDLKSGDYGSWSVSAALAYSVNPRILVEPEVSLIEGGHIGFLVGVKMKY